MSLTENDLGYEGPVEKNFNEIGHVDSRTGMKCVPLSTAYKLPIGSPVYWYAIPQARFVEILSIECDDEEDTYRITKKGFKPGRWRSDDYPVYVEGAEVAATDENKPSALQTKQPANWVADSTSAVVQALKETGDIVEKRMTEQRNDRYSKLRAVLEDAFNQAAQGKGAERHSGGNSLRFEDQRMLTISRMIDSTAGMEFQIIKKVTEALDMPTVAMAKKDLLGAINYIAGCIVFLEERDAANRPGIEH